jgi:hypothetical protein
MLASSSMLWDLTATHGFLMQSLYSSALGTVVALVAKIGLLSELASCNQAFFINNVMALYIPSQ